MADFFGSGRAADLLLAVLALEAAGLALYRGLTGRGPALRKLAPFLVAGGFLALALRAALAGARWPWIAAALTGALVAHVRDLATRWEHGPGG